MQVYYYICINSRRMHEKLIKMATPLCVREGTVNRVDGSGMRVSAMFHNLFLFELCE